MTAPPSTGQESVRAKKYAATYFIAQSLRAAMPLAFGVHALACRPTRCALHMMRIAECPLFFAECVQSWLVADGGNLRQKNLETEKWEKQFSPSHFSHS